MRTREIERINKKLLKMQEEILSEMGRFEDKTLHKNRKENTGEVSSFTTHPADMGAETAEHEKAYILASNESNLLVLVEKALTRIEDGSFGICVECGGKIPLDRLRAIPYALYCMECKEIMENGDYVIKG